MIDFIISAVVMTALFLISLAIYVYILMSAPEVTAGMIIMTACCVLFIFIICAGHVKEYWNEYKLGLKYIPKKD